MFLPAAPPQRNRQVTAVNLASVTAGGRVDEGCQIFLRGGFLDMVCAGSGISCGGAQGSLLTAISAAGAAGMLGGPNGRTGGGKLPGGRFSKALRPVGAQLESIDDVMKNRAL
jgi:hypothetical protein